LTSQVLITGGLGNIGSSVASASPSPGLTIVLDPAQGRGSVETALRIQGVEVINSDLRAFAENSTEFNIDSIVHCAALVNPQVSGVEAPSYNLELTKVAVDLANRLSARLIFVSTTSVYERTKSPVEYANMVTGGSTAYSRGKLDEENFIRAHAQNYSIIRLGSAFGNSLQINRRTAINRIVLSAAKTGEFRAWRLAYDAISAHASIDGIAKALWHTVSSDSASEMTINYAPISVTLRDVHEAVSCFIPNLSLTLEEHPNDSPNHLRIETPSWFGKTDITSHLRSIVGALLASVGQDD
jgi:dTDP-4-dehydrorhamnose reductase